MSVPAHFGVDYITGELVAYDEDIEGVDLDFASWSRDITTWTDTRHVGPEAQLDPVGSEERIRELEVRLDRCASRHVELLAKMEVAKRAMQQLDEFVARRMLQISTHGSYPDRFLPDFMLEPLGLGRDGGTLVTLDGSPLPKAKGDRVNAEKYAEAEGALWLRHVRHASMSPKEFADLVRRGLHEVQYRQRGRMSEISGNQTALNGQNEAINGRRR